MIFRRPNKPQGQPEPPRNSFVAFVGYAADCLIEGQLELAERQRVTDLLNERESVTVHKAEFIALDDGRRIAAGETEISIGELWAIAPTDSQVMNSFHVATRQMPFVVDMPPYRVSGYAHAVAAGDALAGLYRRKPLIPLTDATIEFVLAGQPVRQALSVVIINRDVARFIEPT